MIVGEEEGEESEEVVERGEVARGGLWEWWRVEERRVGGILVDVIEDLGARILVRERRVLITTYFFSPAN